MEVKAFQPAWRCHGGEKVLVLIPGVACVSWDGPVTQSGWIPASHPVSPAINSSTP